MHQNTVCYSFMQSAIVRKLLRMSQGLSIHKIRPIVFFNSKKFLKALTLVYNSLYIGQVKTRSPFQIGPGTEENIYPKKLPQYHMQQDISFGSMWIGLNMSIIMILSEVLIDLYMLRKRESSGAHLTSIFITIEKSYP